MKFRFIGVMCLGMALGCASVRAEVMISSKPLALIYKALQPEQAVSVLLPADRDMHGFTLRVKDIARVQQATRFYWLGPLNEPFLANIEKRSSEKAQWLDVGGGAGHPWLSEAQVGLMAQRIAAAEGQQYPAQQQLFQQRVQDFTNALDVRLHYWRDRLRPLAKKPFLLGHDAFLMFARDIGLEKGIVYRASSDHGHVQAGMQEMMAIQKQLASAQITCVLEEPEVSFAALKKRYPALRVETLDPLANNIELTAAAYLAFVDANALAFERCLQ